MVADRAIRADLARANQEFWFKRYVLDPAYFTFLHTFVSHYVARPPSDAVVDSSTDERVLRLALRFVFGTLPQLSATKRPANCLGQWSTLVRGWSCCWGRSCEVDTVEC